MCREARRGACVGYAEETARSGQTAETCTTGAETGKCAPDHCNVQIGDSVYCSQCSNGGSLPSSPAPTNGVCTADNNECSVKADGRCTTCAQQSFMFKGGCYRIGQDPGQAMCKTAVDGKCTSPQTGYFIPPDATKTDQSIMACNDTTEITLTSNSKKYKGVAHCTQCSTPDAATDTTNAKAATCTACEDGYFINGAACTKCHESCLTCEGGNGADKCKSCKEGYFLGAANSAAGKCVQCNNLEDQSWKGVQNCAKCTKPADQNTPATCTECTTNYYLKKDRSTTSCVADCGEGFFPTTVNSIKKCVSCSETSNGGIANCAKCSLKASSTRAGTAVTCTECTSNKLSPLGDACLAACPAGTYEATATTGSGKICALCHPSCAECNSNANQDSCTACYPGSVLNKTDSSTAGTCIPECTGKYAENCEANQCTAVLVGSKYCSRCKSGFVPVDGLCVSATTRVLAGCTPSTTTAGTCESCKDVYFLQSGGCYQTAVYPGNMLCTTAASGKCTSCANGQTADGSTGSCPACDSTCATCEAANAKQCKTCFSGYYLDANKVCKKCSETSGNIQGVENCVSCLAPTSPSTPTPVTCYVTQDPTVDPADPSVNKTGLSSGAIAGISVAVIAVVGGLVGFLCWWFVCRGKA